MVLPSIGHLRCAVRHRSDDGLNGCGSLGDSVPRLLTTWNALRRRARAVSADHLHRYGAARRTSGMRAVDICGVVPCVRGAVLRSRRRCCTVYSCIVPRVKTFLTECKFVVFRMDLQRYITMTGHMLRIEVRVWAHHDARRCIDPYTKRTNETQCRNSQCFASGTRPSSPPAGWDPVAERGQENNAPCRCCLPRSRRAVLQPAALASSSDASGGGGRRCCCGCARPFGSRSPHRPCASRDEGGTCQSRA